MSTVQESGNSITDIFKTGLGLWADVEMAKVSRQPVGVVAQPVQSAPAQEQSQITGQNMAQGKPGGLSAVGADNAMLIAAGVGALVLVVLAVKG
ncbi:hypothetical protein [uncultured Amphritea sp.]|uniref:hypothetical protein n=1 Tax=uncultured Amphritea sp. TaxID=981605 RepID=UPI00262BB8A9|nr:hypothetical protein [uncultured Amphritea sp.]